MADLTKEEVLEKLSYYSTDKLSKLLNYAENIMIPEEDLLVNATMQQMMNKAFALADIYFPEWTDRSIADFGRFLVEVMAIFSEKDFYYINGYANENLLSKMSIYSDAFMRAVELGYYPNVSRSSQATFRLTVPPRNTAITLPRGSVIIDVTGSGFYFTNLAPIELEASLTPRQYSVDMNEGTLITESFQFNAFTIFVAKSKVDTETLIVTIDDLLWTRTRTFGQSSSVSKHYVAIPEDDGSIRIYFGDDNYGKRPEVNTNVSVNYLRCNNKLADGLFGPCTLNKFPVEVDITSVEMLTTSTGGQDPDTLSDLKNNARNFFFNNSTLNNVFVVRSWLSAQYEVKKNFVKIVNNQVYFQIVPAISTQAESIIIELLRERMQPLVSGGYFAQPVLTEYVNINTVGIQLFFLQGFKTALNIEKAKQLISDYTNPYTMANYGRGFIKTELELLLKSRIEGLQNIIYTDINGALLDITIDANKILRKVPDAGITIDAYEV